MTDKNQQNSDNIPTLTDVVEVKPAENEPTGVSAGPLAEKPAMEEPKKEASKTTDAQVEVPEKEVPKETPVATEYTPLPEKNDKKDKKSALNSNLPDNNTPVSVDQETADEAFSSVQQYLDSIGIRNAQLRSLAEGVNQTEKGTFIDLKGGGKLSFQVLAGADGRPTEYIGMKGSKMDLDAGFDNAAMLVGIAREKGWSTLEVHGKEAEKDAMWLANYKINQEIELSNKAIEAENKDLPEDKQKPLNGKVEISNYRPSDEKLAQWEKEGRMSAPEELGPGISESKFTDVKTEPEVEKKPEPVKAEPAAVEYAAEDEQEAFMTEVGEDIEATKASLLKMTAENENNPTAASKGKCDQQMGELKQKLSTIENLHDHLKSGDRMEKGHFDSMKKSYTDVKDYKQASDFSATKTAPKQEAPKPDASTPAAPSQETKKPAKLKVKLKTPGK